MNILAAIDVVLKLLGALIDAKTKESDDYARVNELLTQLKTLGTESLGRLPQRMNYVREVLIHRKLPPLEDLKGFLSQTGQIINCDARPNVPDNWEIVEHRKGGKLEWDPKKIELFLSDAQKAGSWVVGNELRKELKGKRVLNACVLDWLLDNPEYIPEEWKGKYIFFWGTIYRRPDGSLYVRCLYWSGDRWGWDCHWLGNDWDSGDPAAVLASEN